MTTEETLGLRPEFDTKCYCRNPILLSENKCSLCGGESPEVLIKIKRNVKGVKDI